MRQTNKGKNKNKCNDVRPHEEELGESLTDTEGV